MMECMEAALGDRCEDASLIIIHASIGHSLAELMSKAAEMSPRARIFAASCSGVVGKEGVSESMKDIAVIAITGNDFAVSFTDHIYGNTSYERCKDMATDIFGKSPEVNMVYFMASGIDIANDQCIQAFEDVLGAQVTIFGATSSDNMKGYVSYQGVDGLVFEHGAFTIGFSDPTLKVRTQATHGFEAIGQPMVVTRSSGHVIHELDGKPAWEVYTDRLGLTKEAGCADTIPIGALGEKLNEADATSYGNSHVLRAVTRRVGNDMYYATNIKAGTPLWLTSRNEALIFSEMDRMVEDIRRDIGKGKVVAVFHADCSARGKSMFNRVIKEELIAKMQVPFYQNDECPPWLGMYGFGEFARLNGVNTYHNYTTALYVIYRSE